MKNLRPTIQIVLDTRAKSLQGNYPIKLRITYNRKSRLYAIGSNLNQVDFDRLNSSKLRDESLKKIREHCNSEAQRAKLICDDIENFDFNAFKNVFKGIEQENEPAQKELNLEEHFQAYVAKLKNEGRVSSYESMECALTSFQKFKKGIDFEDIEVKLLQEYENWMIAQNRSPTTIGIYMRNLRVIINNAISLGDFKSQDYPFGKRKYQIPVSQNIKKALTKEEIDLIINYNPEILSNLEMARDFWLFSYLCNGLNIKDILKLRYSNIQDGCLRIIRSKTKRASKAKPKPIMIYLHPIAAKIIFKWSIEKKHTNSFVFHLLQEGISPKRERELIKNFTRFINKNMSKICSELGIRKKVTTYSARHSFGTILKRSGVPIEYISEAYGHSNLRTTELYLDSFDNQQMKKYSELLTKQDD